MEFVILGVTGLLLLSILLLAFVASRWVKVGPNEALIISGRGHRRSDGTNVHYRIVTGGATFVWPVLEKVDKLSLENITLDIITPEFYTRMGVPIKVEAVAQIKVRGDEISIGTAAEQFLSKSLEEIKGVAYQMMAGHLRGMLGTLTVEDIMAGHEAFAQRVQDVSASDLANMGLTVVSFTIREITDTNGYLEALGRPQIAQVKKDATIGEAEANRDATIKSAEAQRQGQLARLAADTSIAEADRDYKMKQADFQASVNERKAQSDLAYDLQRFKTAQGVTTEEVQVELIRKQRETEVQQQEALRREQELIATVRKPAEAERERLILMAEAERKRQALLSEAEAINLKTVAEGRADSIQRVGVAEAEAQKARGLAEAEIRKAQGLSEAEAIKAQGLAQAEAVRAQALAEAEGMMRRAQAWQEYNQAAIAQLLIEKLPDIVRAATEPLSRIDRITLVNSGGGNGTGLGALGKDLAGVLASMPEVVNALTGVDLHKIMANLGQQAEAASAPSPAPNGKKDIVQVIDQTVPIATPNGDAPAA